MSFINIFIFLKGVSRWLHKATGSASKGLPRDKVAAQTYNIYASVSENKDIIKGLALLSTCLLHVKSVRTSALDLICVLTKKC